MSRKLFCLVIAAVVVVTFAWAIRLAAESQSPPPAQPDAQQVISYLNQTIDWFRHVAVEEQLTTDPTDVLFVNDDHQMANQIVRLSFDFARAAAQNTSAQTSQNQTQTPASSRFQSLFQAGAKADADVRQLQTEIEQVKDKLQRATPRNRQTLQSTLDETESELALAQARSTAIHSMLEFVNSGSAGASSNNLLAQIQELQRSIPEAAQSSTTQNSTESQSKPSTPSTTAAQNTRHEQPSGLLALITDLFSLTRKVHDIDDSLQMTDSLAQTSQALRAPLTKSLMAAIQRGDVVAQEADVANAATLLKRSTNLTT